MICLNSSNISNGSNSTINKDLSEIRNELNNAQWEELMKEKTLISNLIEEEMVSRTFYQEGKLQKKLTQDPLIVEAKKILKDQNRYNSILSIK